MKTATPIHNELWYSDMPRLRATARTIGLMVARLHVRKARATKRNVALCEAVTKKIQKSLQCTY